MRRVLLLIAFALVVIASVAVALRLFLAPTTLRIAVGPVGSTDLRIAVGFLQALQRDRASIRLKLVMTDGHSQSAEALTGGKADLAVVRADVAVPAKSATVAILRRDSVFFIVRPGVAIERISDLKGRVIGAYAPGRSNQALLEAILSYHDVQPRDVVKVFGSIPELSLAAQENRIDAIFMIGQVSDRAPRALLRAFKAKDGQSARFLPIHEADVLAEQNPTYDVHEILRGSLTTNPPLPDQNMSTLAVTHRLLARRDLAEETVSELTRLLVALRLQVAQEVPAANQFELPSTDDRAAKLPTHPGTIAYAEGETKTFFERYGDFFYLGVMAFSLVGSAVAALFSTTVGRKSAADGGSQLVTLRDLTRAVANVRTEEEFREIETAAHQALENALDAIATRKLDADGIAALGFLTGELRRALAERQTDPFRAAAE